MEGKFAEELDNGRRVELKRKRAANFVGLEAHNAIPQISANKISAVKLGKRKKHPVCKTKCRTCKLAAHRSLARYELNFMKSGLPKRLLFFQNGEWIDHELDVVALVRKNFENKRATIEVNIKNYHLVLDFLHMVQINLITSLEQPIAWIDEGGNCFFPETFADIDEQHGHYHSDIQKDGEHEPQDIKLQIEIELNGAGNSKFVEYCGESSSLVKRIKVGQIAETEDSYDVASDVRMNEVVGENQYPEEHEVEKAKLGLDPDVVTDMFFKGMYYAIGTAITNIEPNLGFLWQDRFEIFSKQLEITKKYRGNANVCYAWLASSREAASGIMTHGLGRFGFQHVKSFYGIGIHLVAANCADAWYIPFSFTLLYS